MNLSQVNKNQEHSGFDVNFVACYIDHAYEIIPWKHI